MDVIEQVAEHLTALNYRFAEIEGEARFLKLGFSGEHIVYELWIGGDSLLLTMAAHRLAKVPEARMGEALRLANHLNATRLRLGSFWIHPEQRWLSFELPILAPEGPSQEQVRAALMGAGVVDSLYPAFARVLWGGQSVEQALTEPEVEDDDGPSFDLAV